LIIHSLSVLAYLNGFLVLHKPDLLEQGADFDDSWAQALWVFFDMKILHEVLVKVFCGEKTLQSCVRVATVPDVGQTYRAILKL